MACLTPTHHYRRYLLRSKILPKLSPNKSLEIGCGTGEFSVEIAKNGYFGQAIDLSKDAIKLAKKNLAKTAIKAQQNNFFSIKDTFDTIFMFEVLEHLKEDGKALKKIHSLLKKNGLFLFSVPAHQSRFSRDDEWGGHYRRYDRVPLLKLLDKTGFEPVIFWSYGFPIFNLSRDVYNFVLPLFSKKNKASKTKEERTLDTGLDKEGSALIKYLQPVLNNQLLLKMSFNVCDLFLNTNLGSGYLVLCKKIIK